MDLMFALIAGFLVVVFTFYYLEKEISKSEIFWLYSGLAILMGFISLYNVIYSRQSFEYYILMGVFFIFMASLYFEEGETNAAGRAT